MILCDCYLPHDTHDIHVACYNNNISLVTYIAGVLTL